MTEIYHAGSRMLQDRFDTRRLADRLAEVKGHERFTPDDAAPCAAWPGAQLAVRVAARRIYPNCPRYVHRYTLAERSAFVPRAGVPTPIPPWKQSAWACDVLPANDPARPA